MPTIGAPIRKWTLLLLILCSIPTSVAAQATNETHTVASGAPATASKSTTTQHTPTTYRPSTSTTLSPSTSPSRKYTDTETTCPFLTINYITHTLPQQCAKTSWSAPGEPASTNGIAAEAEATASPQISIPGAREEVEGSAEKETDGAPQAGETGHADSATTSDTSSVEPEAELETDSPFDNANFLSFEEWKKKNLAQIGQSPENVGQGRAAASNQPARRRPVNVNALDSLGDEAEIEIDFSGFGTPEGQNVAKNVQSETRDAGATKASDGTGKVGPSSWALSKDAGKTCKERFNYASFDCAATVVKTNKQAKSSSSILVENKDSYMLNECSADNKFLIVELCDDILVDTVVLANYEFFSSMFRHFRVSVSDRYPVKMERWRTLGTFEARNARDIQPFLITEPQIWARYLRIEFLTQFGNEFYCPISLVRVHGTTMMEQFRREEEEARGVDDDEELDEATQLDLVKPAEDSGPLPPDQIPIQPVKIDSSASETVPIENASPIIASSDTNTEQTQVEQHPRAAESSAAQTGAGRPSQSTDARQRHESATSTSVPGPPDTTSNSANGKQNSTAVNSSQPSEATSSSNGTGASPQTTASAPGPRDITSSPTASRNDSAVSSVSNSTVSTPSSSSSVKASSNSTVANPPTQSQSRGSPTQPNAAAPSTQESFFKSIHKRLLHLEANSTLSLQYIEEQSRILRDAFVKVEKRQLAKTEKFLDHLNTTVMHELKSYRNMYDQLWQSTIIELEGMKERQKAEMGEIGTRLSLMADELVWQKRMAVVQSTLLLLCLGLVLFVRSGTIGSAGDVPIVQQLGSKYTSFFESSPPRSPAASGMARRRRTFRNMWRSDTSIGLSDHQSDGHHAHSDADTDGARSPDVQIEYSPPSPDTPGALGAHDALLDAQVNGTGASPTQEQDAEFSTLSPDDQAKRVQVLETQSGPATPNGTRDSRPSWEEVDRAMDQLKAVQQGRSAPSSKKKKKRSPLRRAESSYDCTADDSAADNSGDGLFVD
ncbi:Nn.00g069770.m01.CDS01 [Neocucurbitaria sp. VM-36]